ncbi:MAG TPA: hypothetical protein PK095_24325, partial [Myxococcota bacterium]|nr:hypothetical protein [Myxococcota bacterium]
MALALSKLRDGEHKLTLELRARCGEGEGVFLARGELEVLVDAKGRALLDRIVKLMPALKTDQDAKRLANAAKRVFSPGRVRDFRVLDRDYRIKTGATRVPLSRSLVVAAVVEQGGACTLRLRKVVETYRGNGRFGEPYFDDKLTDVLPPDDAKADLPVPCDLR